MQNACRSRKTTSAGSANRSEHKGGPITYLVVRFLLVYQWKVREIDEARGQSHAAGLKIHPYENV